MTATLEAGVRMRVARNAARAAGARRYPFVDVDEAVQIALIAGDEALQRADGCRSSRDVEGFAFTAGVWAVQSYLRAELKDRKRQSYQGEMLDYTDRAPASLTVDVDALKRGLSVREREVVDCLMRGLTHQQVADRLGLSRSAVSKMIRRKIEPQLTARRTE